MPHRISIFLLLILTITFHQKKANAQLALEQLTTSDFVTSINHAGDDRLFLTSRFGVVAVVENGVRLQTPFLGIQDRITFSTINETGTFSLAFHPEFETNPYVYIMYTGVDRRTTSTQVNTIISRFDVPAETPNQADSDSEKYVLVIPQDLLTHNGGSIAFGMDGMLYASLGDGGGGGPIVDPLCRAQSRDTLLGKIVRIDVNQNMNQPPYHGIPDDNPFVDEGHPMDKVWAIGLRNPWRMTFDRETGDMWIGDVGNRVYEEINHESFPSDGGRNYGWKVMEGITCTTEQFYPGECTQEFECFDEELTLPVTGYFHSFGLSSVTGGYVYRGSAIPYLYGKYLFGDLGSGKIYVYDPEADDTFVLFQAPEMMAPITFGEDVNGELYLSDLLRVYKLVPKDVEATTWRVR